MIKLTAQSGEIIAVNPLHIFAVRRYQGGSGGAAVDVKKARKRSTAR